VEDADAVKLLFTDENGWNERVYFTTENTEGTEK